MGEPKLDKSAIVLAEGQDTAVAAKSRMHASVNNLGSIGMSRRSILNLVAEERYDQAIDDLKAYLDSLPEYPAFKERAERFATYGIELIQAIRAKRSFPGWSTLNMSKQRDLVERAIH
ncbi:MAG: hypothetical protein RBT63_07835, partial [Bdellovibrionales bacterium]|nr:hypothetical protein [Bdellovibrionales bacterium]